MTENIIELTADTMRGDLIDALLGELKAAPDVWQRLSQSDQDLIINRIDNRVSTAIGQAVRMLAADGRPTIKAKLDQMTAKDGIKAVLSVSQHDPGRHELMDSVGKLLLIVVADPEAYLGGETPKSDPDQPELPGTAQEAAGGHNSTQGAPMAEEATETAATAALDAGIEASGTPEATEPPETDEPEANPYDRDDGRIYDAILLIDEDWTGFGSDDEANLARIARWSDEDCRAVEAFCHVVHLQATDPDNAPILPIRPDCIGGPLPGQVQDDAAPGLPLGESED